MENPCVTCGACCAFYRVSFHWMECDPEGINGPLPEHTEKRDHHQVCMLGTLDKPTRCIELEGEVCTSANCVIYERRPSPCRNFGVQMQGDSFWTISTLHLKHCTQARAHYHLPPIVPPSPLISPTAPVVKTPSSPKAA